VNVALNVMAEISIVDSRSDKELIYDKVGIISQFNLEMEEGDVMTGEIVQLQLDVKYQFDSENLPVRNSMNMTEAEYKNFLN